MAQLRQRVERVDDVRLGEAQTAREGPDLDRLIRHEEHCLNDRHDLFGRRRLDELMLVSAQLRRYVLAHHVPPPRRSVIVPPAAPIARLPRHP